MDRSHTRNAGRTVGNGVGIVFAALAVCVGACGESATAKPEPSASASASQAPASTAAPAATAKSEDSGW